MPGPLLTFLIHSALRLMVMAPQTPSPGKKAGFTLILSASVILSCPWFGRHMHHRSYFNFAGGIRMTLVTCPRANAVSPIWTRLIKITVGKGNVPKSDRSD